MTRSSTTQQRLEALRREMEVRDLDYYVVPSSDAHNDEYVPACWQRRAWISGFTGSAGDVIISNNRAYLWTDGRYQLQAQKELDLQQFELMPYPQGVVAPIDHWLSQQGAGKRVGVDPKTISIRNARQWSATLNEIQGELCAIDENLIDKIWLDQPERKTHPIHILDQQYTGVSAKEKIARLQQSMQKLKVNYHVITTLDAIAWLFNIRGTDILYNPLVFAYSIVSDKKAILFCDTHQFQDDQQSYFKQNGIDLQPYEMFEEELSTLKGAVLLDPSITSWWVEQTIHNAKIMHAPSPITLFKAIKNETEIKCMAEAHRRDGLALARFFHWLENHWRGETEMSAADRLEEFRRQDTTLQGLSFNTISGYGDHGAIIHYAVNEKTNRAIADDNLFLLDSGGQYLEGTTDITRTVHLGNPTQEQRHHYTLVLKGHLALRHLSFPTGTRGEHVNAIARMFLWEEGLDFGHGVGHGVGCYLCVHEGPQRIAFGYTCVPLEPGMMVSNEPGLYLEGRYGIRIENVCVVVDRPYPSFYGLDDLTLVPYARNLIDQSMLSKKEKDQINAYHERIYHALEKDLENSVREWLRAATLPL